MADNDNNMTDASSSAHHKDPRLSNLPATSESPLIIYGRWAGWAGGVLLLASLLWMAIVKVMVMPVKVLGILAILALAFWLYTNIQQLMQTIRTRGFGAAANSALFAVLILGCLVLVNFIGSRHHLYRGDFSGNHLYSLSDQTKTILKGLKDPLTITVFVSNEYPQADELRRLLNDYAIGSSKVRVNIYDFKTAIDKVQEYKAQFDGTIYVEDSASKKKEEIRGGNEEQITSAILAVTTGQKTKICFLTGHGEASLDQAPDSGQTISLVKANLQNQQYDCEKLTLMTQATPQIPADCKLLVIAGAKYAPTAKEMAAITKYVDQGGNLLLMLEPAPAPDFAELLKAHGATPLTGSVVDPLSSAEGRPEILAALPQRSHPITSHPAMQIVVLPTARALQVQRQTPPPAMPGAPAPPADKATALLQTSEGATLKGAPAGQAAKGPVAVAVAIDENPPEPQPTPETPEPPKDENKPRLARIVIVGDSDFATDGLMQAIGEGPSRQNQAFALMAINWLVNNDRLVSIPPKTPAEAPLTMTDTQARLVNVLVVGVVPLLIIIAGTLMWWLRRRT